MEKLAFKNNNTIEFMENETICISDEFMELFQYYKEKYRISKWIKENNINYFNRACKKIAFYIMIYKDFNNFTQGQLETFLKWYYEK